MGQLGTPEQRPVARLNRPAGRRFFCKGSQAR